MEAITSKCANCTSNHPIVLQPLKNRFNNLVFTGKCNNAVCPCPSFYVCKPCFMLGASNCTLRGGRKSAHFTSIRSVRKHVTKSQVHKQSIMEYYNAINVTTSNDIKIIEDENSNFFDAYIEDDNSNLLEDNNNDMTFSNNAKSINYYKYDNKLPGSGTKYLIGNAFQKKEDDYEKISEEEVEFFLKLSSLLMQLTKVQQQLLADILLAATNSKDKDLSIFGEHTRVPTSILDFEHIILSKKTSILKNLPHPVVKETDGGSHAYVSLIDLLSTELAANTKFDPYAFNNDHSSNVNELKSDNKELISISKSKAAEDLYWKLYEPLSNDGTFVMYLWLKEWRDAFDPNSTKSSRNQVWMQTFTISPPEDDKGGKNTFLMSISGKSEDHSVMDHIYGKEIEHLSTVGHKFYYGQTNSIIRVKLGKLIICVDRPERASMFLAGDHAGLYSTMWGNAGHVDGQMKKNYLPSCVQCRAKRIMEFFETGITYQQDIECDSGKNCCGWNVYHDSFTFPTPNGYPTVMDSSINAPKEPFGREIMNTNKIIKSDNSNYDHLDKKLKVIDGKQVLKMNLMSTQWLKDCCKFAFHQISNKNTDTKSKKSFWNKSNCISYLRTCGISSDLIQNIYSSSNVSNHEEYDYPKIWDDETAFEKCHYAGMHMLFLGHSKSNYDMLSIWLSKHSLTAGFGKQANLYLDYVKRMRVGKYFSPHNVSTSTWGTGTWVSENYLFFARAQKFFITLPAVSKSKLMLKLDMDFIIELRTILRFITSAHASISRIMSAKKIVKEMDCFIKIYMDCMVEMDSNILKNATSETFFWEQDLNINDESIKKKKPNFVKSNSLGILSVAKAHEYFGPLLINWEGGYSGERKIQEIKPLLSIKRDNADWEKITLSAHYQLQTLTMLLRKQSNKSERNRDSEGVLKVFNSYVKAEEAVNLCVPLSCILDKNHNAWIAYRPSGEETTRSSVTLLQLEFNDKDGENVLGICWMSPIKMTKNTLMFESMELCCAWGTESALLLPQLSDNGLQFINKYYAIGHKWTERNNNGIFECSNLSFDDIFKDWEIITPENTSL